MLECTIEETEDGKLMYVNVRGSAFLWHQVRCMSSVLFMVGLGRESTSIVAELLDLERTPRKPRTRWRPNIHSCCGEADTMRRDWTSIACM